MCEKNYFLGRGYIYVENLKGRRERGIKMGFLKPKNEICVSQAIAINVNDKKLKNFAIKREILSCKDSQQLKCTAVCKDLNLTL